MLKLYIGCMYAGKSTAMLRDLQRYQYAGKTCVVVKHTSDTRYDHVLGAAGNRGGIVCHDMYVWQIDTVIASTLAEAESKVSGYDCIGISEAQFYDDIVLADTWAESRIVIAEGLDGLYTRENFGQLHKLIPKADRVVKLTAVCAGCGGKAAFTRKISGDMNAEVDVGGADKYRPVCRRCWSDGAAACAAARIPTTNDGKNNE